MNIQTFQLIDGARKARGLAVVIDVFRAFTVEPYLISLGAKTIHPVASIDQAYELKDKTPNAMLVGEREEQKPPGFDCGNSPTEAKTLDFKGKTVIHTTSSGTQGIANAVNADEILTGSFVNAPAIVRYIQQQKPENVSLVCMGYASLYPTEEDTFCAKYIEALLTGKEPDFNNMVNTIRETSGKRFFVPEKQSHAPESDFHICLEVGVFDFVLKVEKNKAGLNYVTRINC
ncbi:MAG: 2-phosphosulfolactate phosphatase [Bacteroidota bacterium]